MGRVKNTKKNIAKRNQLNLAKRYQNSASIVVDEETVRESRPSCQPSNNVDLVTDHPSPTLTCNSNRNAGMPNVKNDPPTGFALYSSYQEQIQTDETAPKYIMVDLELLTSFICQFPCSECNNKSLEVGDSGSKGYAHSINLHCTSCLSDIVFITSRQSGHSAANSTRAPYDINRRMVQAFTSLGKGHRGMETFSMHLNMKAIACKAYDRHLDQLHTTYAEAASETLEKARVEVRKAYTLLENLPIDYAGPIDISVSYDGSWQKRGFTSKKWCKLCCRYSDGPCCRLRGSYKTLPSM